MRCSECGEAIPKQSIETIKSIHDCLAGTRYHGRRFCSITCRSDFVAGDLVDDYHATQAAWRAAGLWDCPSSELRA